MVVEQSETEGGTIAETNKAANTAPTEAARQQQYQTEITTALRAGDYQRAQALLSEYNNGYTRDLNTAKNLAAYGDFSGYAGLYGQETAASMAALWKAQNPELAYNTGRMSTEEYKAITGKYPKGYQAAAYTPKTAPEPETVSDLAKSIANTIAAGNGNEMKKAMNYALENSGNFNDKELEIIANAYAAGRDTYQRNKYTGR